MFKLILKNKLLLFALVLGSVLRLWALSTNPPHLYSDEASLGYNAYSILKTGRDEHGEFLPIIFKSFGDWKPGLYVYLTVPFIAALGLNELTVRLPSALMGILSIYFLFLVVKNLFTNKSVATISALVLATTPWHIHFSRGAWEANLALTLLLLGVYLFTEYLKGKNKYLIFSTCTFALTLWAYQGSKLFSSLLFFVLLISNWPKIVKTPHYTLIKSTLLGLLVVAPILLSVLQGKTGRLEVFSVFSYSRPKEYIEGILSQENAKTNSIQYLLFHSEKLSYTQGVLSRWLNHFSSRFLFFEGDWNNPRHNSPDTGMLLLYQAPFLVLGLIQLVGQYPKSTIIILFWLTSSILPSALSRDSVHAIRSYNMIVPLVVLIGLGLYSLINRFKAGKQYFVIILVSLIYIVNLTYYLDSLFIHYPKRDSKAWLHGYREVFKELKNYADVKQIVFQQSYNQPYIFYLFYNKYEPKKYQAIVKSTFEQNSKDVGKVSFVENISFRNAVPADTEKPGTLIVYDRDFPPFTGIQNISGGTYTKIKRPDNNTAFEILEIK